MKTINFRGIRRDEADGCCGLPNPERGLRVESMVALMDGEPLTHSRAHHLQGKIPPLKSNNQWWLLDMKKYERFGVTLIQTYCYLDEFIGMPISDQKLLAIEKCFALLRKNGYKCLLTFAYERDPPCQKGPILADIFRHIDQIAPIIRRNTDVIFVMQAGFVGAWGEWHSAVNIGFDDWETKAGIMDAILDMLPKDRMTQLRVPRYKRLALRQGDLKTYVPLDAKTAHSGIAASRIGFTNYAFLADDGTCAGTWPEPPYFSSPGNPEFDFMTKESPYVVVDGELLWGFQQKTLIDGLAAAQRLHLHHYTSFSLAHQFSDREEPRMKAGEHSVFSMDRWMVEPLSMEQVAASKIPVSDLYFKNILGNTVPRTPFEYIRDHLGYRFELQTAVFTEKVSTGETTVIEINLINRGFDVVHNPRPVIIALINAAEKVFEFEAQNTSPLNWQPFNPEDADGKPLVHKFGIRIPPGKLEAGWYQLGIWLPDAYASIRLDPRYAIRFANGDVPWWTDAINNYGINIIGVIQVTDRK